MATIKQVKNELRHKGWAKEIAECQSSGMRISEWCHMKGISCNTYYRRLRIVRNEFLERAEAPVREIIPLSIATTPTTKEVPNDKSAYPECLDIKVDYGKKDFSEQIEYKAKLISADDDKIVVEVTANPDEAAFEELQR